MRRKSILWLCLFVIGTTCAAAQGGDEQFLGTWSGTWEGAGSGGFDLTLEKSKDGPITGSVSITGEPTYKATLKTLSFDGNTMTASYDFPPDPAAEVVLVTTFDGKKATGTWLVRGKEKGNEVASGTWTVTKK
jgi:hypothetical protein